MWGLTPDLTAPRLRPRRRVAANVLRSSVVTWTSQQHRLSTCRVARVPGVPQDSLPPSPSCGAAVAHHGEGRGGEAESCHLLGQHAVALPAQVSHCSVFTCCASSSTVARSGRWSAGPTSKFACLRSVHACALSGVSACLALHQAKILQYDPAPSACPCSHAASGLPPHGKENGENGTPLMMSHRNASVEAILRMVQVRASRRACNLSPARLA